MHLRLFILFYLLLHSLSEFVPPDDDHSAQHQDFNFDEFDEFWNNTKCGYHIVSSNLEGTTTLEGSSSDRTTMFENGQSSSHLLLSTTLKTTTDQEFSTEKTTTLSTASSDQPTTKARKEQFPSSDTGTTRTTTVAERTSTQEGNTSPLTFSSENDKTSSTSHDSSASSIIPSILPGLSTNGSPSILPMNATEIATSEPVEVFSIRLNDKAIEDTTDRQDFSSSEVSNFEEEFTQTISTVSSKSVDLQSTASALQEGRALKSSERASLSTDKVKSTKEIETITRSVEMSGTFGTVTSAVTATNKETEPEEQVEPSTLQRKNGNYASTMGETSETRKAAVTVTGKELNESPEGSTTITKADKTTTQRTSSKASKLSTTSKTKAPQKAKSKTSKLSTTTQTKAPLTAKSMTRKLSTTSQTAAPSTVNSKKLTTGPTTSTRRSKSTTTRHEASKKTVQTRKSTTTPKTRFTKQSTTEDIKAKRTTVESASTIVFESSTFDPSCRLACPPGWSYAAGKCFMMITNGTKISYSICLAHCEAAGGTLVGFFELINPSVRMILQKLTSDIFNTSIIYSNAYKSNVLRVQNYLYTHNLSMGPQEMGSSWTSKRIDQPKNYSIVNWCMKPAFCQPFKCPVFEIVHLSQGIYQTGHLNPMTEVKDGTVVNLKCVELNADKTEWNTTCGKKGYWTPHPTYGQCIRTWGLARTIVDRQGYTKTVDKCDQCHPVGTLRCKQSGNDYQCLCKALYEGHHCELTPRWCEQWPKAKDPCGVLGQCTENLHEWYCKCHNENRTGTRCEYDRTNNSFNPFETNENVRHYFSPAMFSHLTIGVIWFASWHTWKMLRIQEAKRANDRVDWLQNLRFSAVGVRSILITMAGNPSIADLDSPGRFCTWVALVWTSIAILFWHLAEAHSLLQLVRGVHLNSLRNVNGKPAIKLLMGYFVTPIVMMVIWFASVHDSWDKLLMFPTHWSTLGSMENPIYYEVCYTIAVLGAVIQLATIAITIIAEAERRGPNHALNRSLCCFHYWKPKRTEVMDKAFRSSIPNVVCSLLVLVHTVASAFSFDRPDNKDYERMTSVSGMILAACYFFHTRVLCYSEVWEWVIELSMVYLPKKWSPSMQPLSLFTRDEVLMRRAPHRLEREEKEEEKKKEMELNAAIAADEARRTAWLKRWPHCPSQLVPHVRQYGPEEIKTDTTWPFSPSDKDYFCQEHRHQVFMNLASAYFKDRLKRRHAPESSAFIAARELFGAQLHPRPQHMVEKQLKQFYKEFSELAEKDDWLILGRDQQSMASFKKWDQMFYPGLEKLYKVFPHHDPRPPLYKNAMKLMEKSKSMWFYPYVDDLPTNIVIPTPYPLWTKWETFVEPLKISTEKQLHEAIAKELEQLEKHNQIWDWIYDNDPWVVALDQETREKLKAELDIKDGALYENPRLLPINRINDRLWDERRPGFVGPRRRMTRPTFKLWELSLEREYLEEQRQEYWKSLEKRSFRAHLDAGLTEERRNPRFVKFWIFNNQPPPPLHEQRIKFQPHIDRTPF